MRTPIRLPERLRSPLAGVHLPRKRRPSLRGPEQRLIAVADAARLPFERAAWALERNLIWPLQRRFADWDTPLRGLAMGALVLLAAAAGVAGFFWATPGGNGASLATRAPQINGSIASKPPARAVEPHSSHVLHGVPPVFSARSLSGGAAKVANEKAVRSPSVDPSAARAAAGNPGASISSAAGIVGKPAGPAALAVARRFSDAFVLYETGAGATTVNAGLAATATPALAQALLRRPPRQPATVKVPRAKVLNVVAGPSSGGVYTVSVSLLRVGLTSELRLEMEKAKNGRWHVTDVLG